MSCSGYLEASPVCLLVGKRHLVNVCPALITINSFDWVPLEDKVRLLEWLIRMDILQYAAAACPPLPLERLSSYVPKDKKAGPANGKQRIKSSVMFI